MKRNSFLGSEDKARNYAFLLLKFRPRSEQELRARLKRKNFAPGIIESTLRFLKEKGFVDDDAFAKTWVNSRLLENFGACRIRQELELKGVSEPVINARIKEALIQRPEEAVIRTLAKNKMKRIKEGEAQKAKRKIYAYLARRGFASGDIIDALESL